MKKFVTAFCIFSMFTTTNVFASANASADTYTVKKGDVLWKIAKNFNVQTTELIKANPKLTNPDILYPGLTIIIPSKNDSKPNDTIQKPSNNESNEFSGQVSAFEKEVVELVNKQRQANGLSPLKLNTELSNVARMKSQDMKDKNYFSHTSPTYGSPFDMMKKFNISYKSAGENIAKGQKTPQAVVNAWMNSEGHRKNILSKSFTEIGVGYIQGNNTTYWTQMFITK